MLLLFNDTAPTEIYTLSLHDALPIYLKIVLSTTSPARGERITIFSELRWAWRMAARARSRWISRIRTSDATVLCRSEEHTSELQSQSNLVCRLLLEKKNKK